MHISAAPQSAHHPRLPPPCARCIGASAPPQFGSGLIRSEPLSRTRAVFAPDEGLTLIEVLIASLLVAVIAIGAFSAFSAAGRSTLGARTHAQAVELAGQNGERLRGFTTTELAQFGTTTTVRAENGACIEQVASAWQYWSKGTTWFCENPPGLSGTSYAGTPFTVTSSARYVTAETGGTGSSLTCETTAGAASYLQTTSSVTWPSLGNRPAVSQSSIVYAPQLSALLVRVLNQSNEPVAGATVAVGGISPEATQNTSTNGCVIFGALPAGPVTVTGTKTNWVNENAESAPRQEASPSRLARRLKQSL